MNRKEALVILRRFIEREIEMRADSLDADYLRFATDALQALAVLESQR